MVDCRSRQGTLFKPRLARKVFWRCCFWARVARKTFSNESFLCCDRFCQIFFQIEATLAIFRSFEIFHTVQIKSHVKAEVEDHQTRQVRFWSGKVSRQVREGFGTGSGRVRDGFATGSGRVRCRPPVFSRSRGGVADEKTKEEKWTYANKHTFPLCSHRLCPPTKTLPKHNPSTIKKLAVWDLWFTFCIKFSNEWRRWWWWCTDFFGYFVNSLQAFWLDQVSILLFLSCPLQPRTAALLIWNRR